WISERKDVLSGLFFMLTLLAYSRCSSRREEAPSGVAATIVPNDQSLTSAATRKWHLLTLIFFALGLMSKPMLVTVPFVLVLLDYWPLGRLGVQSPKSKVQSLKWLFLQKWPFFLLTAVSCAITYLAQQRGGAVETLEHVPLEGRLANALVAYAA